MSNSLEVSGVNVNASGVRIGHTDVQDTGLDASTSSGISTKPSVSLVNIGFSGTPKAPQAGLGLNFALFNFGNNFGLGSGASVDGSEDSGRGGQRLHQRDYQPNNAIEWYTLDSFLYSLLNRGLRQKDFVTAYIFGFFLQDLYQQLKYDHEVFKLNCLEREEPLFTVYRGQWMSTYEINYRKEHTDLCHINNSLLSTSLDKAAASSFLGSPETKEGLERVLFKIEIDVRKRSRPYADISQRSHFKGEAEVLFMVGTRFKQKNAEYDETMKVWIITWELISDNFKKDDESYAGGSKRRTLKNYFNELPTDLIGVSLFNINVLHIVDIDDYTSALTNYIEAYKVWSQFMTDEELNCYINIADICEYIGSINNYHIKDETKAQFFYDQAIIMYKRAFENATTDYERMLAQNNLTGLYKTQMAWREKKEENALMSIKYKEDYRNGIR
ncbi:unnamed protein product [Didymodactylos carnosus]|uniref:Uncharacterized protein n=1 Tax=Didymodactylos carnosus TaxID=1234261 RepID=A0A815YH75_9BILA|nr:unnamed protein product [Didymodactylos carnosus]CAF4433995.1 unnamed protein product [Didymodactylos carnosus]